VQVRADVEARRDLDPERRPHGGHSVAYLEAHPGPLNVLARAGAEQQPVGHLVLPVRSRGTSATLTSPLTPILVLILLATAERQGARDG